MSNRPVLQLHVPEPPARPGDAPDLSHVAKTPVGATRRPEPTSAEADMRDLPYGLVRVLDDDGVARGPWNPRLPAETLLAGLKAMLRTRLFDDRLFRAHRQGKTSFYMKSLGEEAIGAAASMALAYDDMAFPTYRLLAWLMARDYPMVDLVNQIFSNAADPLKGRQLPILYSAKAYGFFSISGNVGTQLINGVGWAMASAYRGADKIAIAWTGEGSTATNDFHAAATFASVYRPPAILAVTNNQWAISSFQGFAGGEATTFAARATGYGLPGLRVDGNDFLAVWAAVQWAAERARANLGATLIEFFTYRAGGHSTSDDPTKYRPAEEGGQWPYGDPLERLKDHLIALGVWDEARHAALSAELDAEIRAAVKAGEAVGTLGKSKPSVKEMFEGVFKAPDWRLVEQRGELGI